MESASNCSTKKRKNCYGEEVEEDQEAKMEEFFALVRSIRESRERLMNLGSDGYGEIREKGGKKMKEKEEENKVRSVWKPEFKVEDFFEEKKYCPLNIAEEAGNSEILGATTMESDDKEAQIGMDLTLSL